MTQKAILTYFEGRGKAECIRLALAAARIEWTDSFLKEPSDIQQLRDDGKLVFGQVPLLEINGKNLVQSGSTVRYIAREANLLGANNDEAVHIDILYEGTRDLLSVFMGYAFSDKDAVVKKAKDEVLPKYLPIFERVLKNNGSTGYLVGNKLTLADVGLLEPLVWVEELLSAELLSYTEIQKFLQTVKNHDGIKSYLNGPQRQRINDDRYCAEVRRVLKW